MDTLDVRYWNERAVEIDYKRIVPGVMLYSHVFFKECMDQKLVGQ